MNQSFGVETSVNKSTGEIVSVVWIDGVDINDGVTPVREDILRQVFATQDRQVRDALVELGWTPPKEELRTAGAASVSNRSADSRI